jgi:hypothetical protein
MVLGGSRQATGASVVAVRPVRGDIGLLGRQMHGFHDLGEYRLPPQNAAIGIECESLCLCIEDDSTTRGLLILNVRWHGYETLLLRPEVDVAPVVGQTISVRLCLAEQTGIENHSVPQQPKDSYPRFT